MTKEPDHIVVPIHEYEYLLKRIQQLTDALEYLKNCHLTDTVREEIKRLLGKQEV